MENHQTSAKPHNHKLENLSIPHNLMMQQQQQQQQQQMFGASRMAFSALSPFPGGGESAEPRDCESEEGVGVSEEPARPARPRGSGSKRSRAAEVHNLSEKRRRSRINEKMKALQSLIPNSNKTDKASMLDEAIEYLKQLQLQVQMLSMRNGLFLHPSYLSGAMESVQASQMCEALAGNNGTGSNSGAGMLPLNQNSGAQHSFDPLNPHAQNHPPLVLPSMTRMTVPEPLLHVESSQPHLGSFHLPVSAEEEIMTKNQLTSSQELGSLPGTSQDFTGKASSTVNADHFDGCTLSRERSQDMVPKNTESLVFMQHLHSLQSGDTDVDVKTASK